MKTCLIIAGGDYTPICPREGEYIIACDRGYAHALREGIRPQLIMGDFDSYSGALPEDIPVERFKKEKDDTDTMLAVRLGLERGCDFFLFYGAMDGPRLDHTVANFQTLAYLATHGARGALIGRDYIATVLSGESIEFPAAATGILSLFCLGASAEVTIKGLQYPLDHGILTPDFPLGVSNHFVGRAARITVHDGLVLALWDRGNGLGARVC